MAPNGDLNIRTYVARVQQSVLQFLILLKSRQSNPEGIHLVNLNCKADIQKHPHFTILKINNS